MSVVFSMIRCSEDCTCDAYVLKVLYENTSVGSSCFEREVFKAAAVSHRGKIV